MNLIHHYHMFIKGIVTKSTDNNKFKIVFDDNYVKGINFIFERFSQYKLYILLFDNLSITFFYWIIFGNQN